MDTYLKLSDPQVKEAIYLLLSNFDEKLRRRDISCRQYRIFVRGKCVLYYDRHMHYPTKIEHGYALYGILESLKRVCSPRRYER